VSPRTSTAKSPLGGLDEAALRARIVDLKTERDTYRSLFQEVLSALNQQTTTCRRVLGVVPSASR
jgi:hypothetical protein